MDTKRLELKFNHDIIRLPGEACVDHDHEVKLHDIINFARGKQS